MNLNLCYYKHKTVKLLLLIHILLTVAINLFCIYVNEYIDKHFIFIEDVN